MSDLPWLDPQRFPQRRFLANPGVAFFGTGGAESLAATQQTTVVRQWQDLLGLGSDSLAVFASQAEAVGVALPIAAGELVLLSAPASTAVVPRLLQAGARYVDVGRTVDGRPDLEAWRLAVHTHPDAWVYVSCDQPVQSDWETALQAGAKPERTLLHAGGGFSGLKRYAPEVWPLLTWLALRDPDDPASAVLWAVAGQGLGPALQALRGPLELPHPLVQRAEVILAGLVDSPDWPQDVLALLELRSAALARAVADWPGAVLWPARDCLQRLVRCMAGDAAALADKLAPQGWICPPVTASSLGDFLVVDLVEGRSPTFAHAVNTNSAPRLPPLPASGIV
jgi:hypothetical protein